MVKKIIVKYYFDKEIRIIGFILFFFPVIILAITTSWTIFLVSTIVGLFLFTTHYEVILNKREGYYKRSLNIIGIRFGKREKFEKILSCNILKGKFTDLYMVGPFGISTEGEMYHAFIEFSNGNLIQIGKSKDKRELLKKINFFRFDYSVDIVESEDNTLITNEASSKIVKSYPEKRIGKNLTITGLVSLLFGIVSAFQDLPTGSLSLFSIVLISISVIALIIGLIKIKTQANNGEHS